MRHPQPVLNPPRAGGEFRVAVFVERFPVLTETFVTDEIRYLRKRGIVVDVFACTPAVPAAEGRDPAEASARMDARKFHPLGTPARVLRQLLRHPRRTWTAVGILVRVVMPAPRGAWYGFRALVLACEFAMRTPAGRYSHLHAHFLNRPALVAVLASTLTRTPASLSAHARDVFVPELRMAALVRWCRFAVVCSNAGLAALRHQLPAELHSKLTCLHHGIALETFRFRPRPRRSAPGTLRVLSVARLVPKKGLDTVVRALAHLDQRGWRTVYRLIGDGNGVDEIHRLAGSLGICIEHHRRVPHPEIAHFLNDADVFVLGCRVARDGDRDGVPNAILEAMAAGVPVVVTAAGGVADVVRDRDTGMLVTNHDPAAIADAIESVVADPVLRARVSRRARDEIETRFDIDRNIHQLVARLQGSNGTPCHPSA